MDHARRTGPVSGAAARRAAWALLAAVPLLLGVALGARGEDGRRHDEAQDLALGEALYAAHCAACHGTELEGQPDWRRPGPDGIYPAPPHSAEGHTWHHSDALLFDYVRLGGEAMMAERGIAFASGMPAFGDVLSDEEIRAVLGYIASTWPEDIRAAQEALE